MKFNTPPRSPTNELLHWVEQWIILQNGGLGCKAGRDLELKCEDRITALLLEITRPTVQTLDTATTINTARTCQPKFWIVSPQSVKPKKKAKRKRR